MAWVNYNVNVCDRSDKHDVLFIHLTKECPNACSFCVDKLNPYKQIGKPNFDKIKETFLQYKDKPKNIIITGGEPLLYINEVLDLCKLIKRETKANLTLDTSIPIQCYKHQDVFFEIIDLVDAVLMSGHHYDAEKADIIRNSKSKFDRNEFYQTFPHKEKFLVSINVFKPHLCEKQEVFNCIMYFYQLGFNSIKIAEMFDMPDMYVSIGELLGIKLNTPFAQGCTNRNVDVSKLLPEFKGNLTVKTVCFYRCRHLKPSLSDFVKILTRPLFVDKNYFKGVIHPDGNIYPHWV